MRLKAFFAMLLSLSAISAYAQFKASIQGTVLDAKGGAVAGAKVNVKNEATGVARGTVASDQGFYRVSELPPGSYTVSVEAAGFKQSVSTNVGVKAEEPRGFNVTLAVGAVQESVTVTAASAALLTENAHTRGPLDTQE